MVYLLTITLTANLDFLLYSGSNTAEGINVLTDHFHSLRDWCIINLDVGTWEMGKLTTKSNDDALLFSLTFTFNNAEDVTAFKLTFDINTDYVCN